MSRELTPLEKFLQNNWYLTYTLTDLTEMGVFGTKNQVRYILRTSEVVRRHKRGHYQFSALGYGNCTTLKDHIKKLLVSGQQVSTNALVKEFGIARSTVQSIICNLRAERLSIISDTCYSIKNAPKKKV